MDLDSLSKTQIILLTLLVSFVTSIATGIVTVTLLQQAPTGVTQTINRVVEKTVERVVPGDTKIVERIKEVETVKTEDDLIISAVNNSAPALVQIITSQQNEAGETLLNIQTGFFVGTDNIIATADFGFEMGKTYEVAWNNDKRTAEVVALDPANHLAILHMLSAKDSAKKDVVTAIPLSSAAPTLGQTVLALGAHDNNNPTVSSGIISGIRQESASTTPRLQTTVDINQSNRGGPLLNLKGEVIGVLIESQREIGSGVVAPVSLLTKLLSKKESSTIKGTNAAASGAGI